MKRIMLFLTFAVLFSLQAHAQWDSKVSLGSSFYKGNVDKFNIHTKGSVSHADSTFEYSTSAEATYSETDGQRDNQLLQASLKFDYLPYGTISPFTAVSAYNNEPRKIKLRLSGMVGAKYTFVNMVNEAGKETADYSISAAIQLDRERYTSDAEGTEKLRLSVRPKFEHQLNEHVYFEHVTFYIPKISNYKDFVVDSRTSLKSKLSEKLSLDITYKLEHLSRLPDAELENTDHALIASLVLDF